MTKLADWFYAEDVPPTSLDVLWTMAEQFVRAGGVLSLMDWDRMNVHAKAAVTRAREVVEIEQAARIGLAMKSPEAVLSPIDGGAALAEKLADTALDAAASKRGWS